jgi:hypothetical protein
MLPSAPTPSREGEDARGTRPAHLAMDQPPASACNTDPEPLLTPGHCSPRSGASGHRFAGPSPRVAPEKRDQLGHRSHAPATFFEVRFASLFEARCRLFVSAITRLGGMTRSSFRIPARRGPRPSSSSRGGPPLRERRRTCRRRAFEICHPARVFPTGTRRRDWFPNPADMNSRWLDACDTANSARPMPGERREGRRTKRRTRHRDVCALNVVTQVAIAWRWPTEVPLLGGLRTPGSLA